MKPWKILHSKNLIKNKWLNLSEHKLQRSDGKIVEQYYKISKQDYVVIIAVDKNKNIIMERQYRLGADNILLELPAGFIEKDEKPIDAAIRELKEETGYVGKNPKYLGYFYPSAGFLEMKGHIVLLETNKQTESLNLDATEEIEIVKYPFEKVLKMVKNNEINDVSAMMAISLYKLLHQK